MKARFTRFEKGDNWVEGFVGRFVFEAKMFDEGSDFGINNGRVSKLFVREKLSLHSWDAVIISYDRGWDVQPKPNTFASEVLDAILELCENAPKLFETA